MFCSKCGHKNKLGAKFCESCGFNLETADVIKTPAIGRITSKNPSLGRVASIGGALAIICFFLPWVSVSCKSEGLTGTNLKVDGSGYEIATGSYGELNSANSAAKNIQSMFGSSYDLEDLGITKYPMLFIVPLLGIVGLLAYTEDRSMIKAAGISGVVGILILLFIFIKVIELRGQIESNTYGYVKVSQQIGYWGEWIGMLAMTATGYLTWKNKR